MQSNTEVTIWFKISNICTALQQIWILIDHKVVAISMFVVQRCLSLRPTSSTWDQLPHQHRHPTHRCLKLVLNPLPCRCSACHQYRCFVLQSEWSRLICRWDQADRVVRPLHLHVWVDHLQEDHSHPVCVMPNNTVYAETCMLSV